MLKWKSLISANTLFRSLISIRINYTDLHQSSEHNHLKSTVYEWNIITARGWRWRWLWWPLAGVARSFSVRISMALCCDALVLCSVLTEQTSAWITDCTLQVRECICCTDSDAIHKYSKQLFNCHVTDRSKGYLRSFLHKVTAKDLQNIFRPWSDIKTTLS